MLALAEGVLTTATPRVFGGDGDQAWARSAAKQAIEAAAAIRALATQKGIGIEAAADEIWALEDLALLAAETKTA